MMIRTTRTIMAALMSCAIFSHAVETSQRPPETTIEREEKSNPKVTALYMISSEGDYIGQGNTNSYLEERDGKFTISSNNKSIITINYRGHEVDNRYGENWSINFTAPDKELLKPGIYKDAARIAIKGFGQPGFYIIGCGRGCNKSSGEFEILEIEYDNAGKVEAFAANFIQKCEIKGPPLFGSVRYNSAMPFEVRFSEVSEQKPKTVLYIIKRDPSSGITQPTLISNDEGNVFSFKQLPYGGEGIEVSIESSQGSWVLDFAAPLNGNFGVGFYGEVSRYPFHSSFYPGIGISTPEGGFTQPSGGFDVAQLEKDADGKINALALNFKVENEYGEVLKGAIRFNSKLTIDFHEPYKE
jgi:hypothetical protein